MDIVSWEEFLRGKKKNGVFALTIGVFDGVHQGHKRLLKTVWDFAHTGHSGEPDMQACVISFRENPKKILHPKSYPGDILVFEDKLAKFEKAGMDCVVIIDFSLDFGKLKGVDFMSLICDHCRLRFLAIGEDFHFGYRLDTGAEKVKVFLEPMGVKVDIIPPVYHEGERISSTCIRGFILNGNVTAAARMLGYGYTLIGQKFRGRDSSARAKITQVLPRKGSFPALFEGTSGQTEGVLTVDEHGISWHYNGDVEAITFLA